MRISVASIWAVALLGWSTSTWATNSWSAQDYDLYPGDFNGDGFTDLLYVSRNPSMPSGILLSDGTSPATPGQSWLSDYLGISWSSNTYTVVVGDFNGDGKADIFLQSDSPGDSYLLLTDANGRITAISQTVSAQAMGEDWSANAHHLVVGDFNGDGRDDLLLQPVLSGGTAAVVLADEAGQFSSQWPFQTWSDGYLGFNWSVQRSNVYAGDFNGDGRSDLLIQAQPSALGVLNGVTQYDYQPKLNGVVLAAKGARPFGLLGMQLWDRMQFGVDWSPLTNQLVIGDFNGDGRSDVLLQPYANGSPARLLYGRATGHVFGAAAAPLAANGNVSANSAVLLPGRFAGGNTQGLFVQSLARSGTNSITRNIGGGIVVNDITFADPAAPALTAPLRISAAPVSGTNAVLGAASLASAAAVAPTSAGRTAAQFSVTPTGAASYNIPLWTPPGARDLEPNLALHYASGGPDGPMGPGWSIVGTSAITRCGKTWVSTNGAPAGVKLTSADDACLDGNRLRVVSGTVATPMLVGTTFTAEIADFSLVTAAGTAGAQPTYFTVKGKDGRFYEYGNTADSRVSASGAPAPYAWLLDKVSDRQGNSMTFAYVAGATVPTLSTISYTNTGNGTAAPYQVTFNYITRTGGTTISKYVSGYPVSIVNQLDNVTVAASGVTVRKYQLSYTASTTTNRPLLGSLQECGGSGGTDCLRATTFSYQVGATGWSASATSIGLTGQYGFIPADLNGDGIPDALYGKLSGSSIVWYAKIATLAGFGAEIPTGASTPAQSSGPPTMILGSFNGRSPMQFLAAVGTTWWVYSLNAAGTGFTSASTGVTVNGELSAVDYDGDGLPDLVSYSSTSNLLVRRNTTAPGGAVAFASTASNVWTFTGTFSSDPTKSYAPPRSLDFNGDGKADFVFVTGTCTKTCMTHTLIVLSNGFGAQATVNSELGYVFADSMGDWNGDGCTDSIMVDKIRISDCNGKFLVPALSTGVSALTADYAIAVDWDGDGLTDLVYTDTTTNQLYLVRSTGNGVAAPVALGIPAPTTRSYFVMDRDSDGQPDLCYVDSAASYAVGCYMHKGANTPPDLLTNASDGFGIGFSPTYVSMTHGNFTASSGAVFPNRDFQGPTYAVNQFAASDGLGTTYTNDFWYYGAVLNLQGRGFTGFAKTRQHDSRTGFYEYTLYSQSFPTIGSITEKDGYQSDNTTLISKLVNTYVSPTLASETGLVCATCYFPHVSSSTSYAYEVAGAKKGLSISNTVTTYGYTNGTDTVNYGIPTDTRITLTDTDATAPASPFNTQAWVTEVKNTITNDTTNWCLGRPSRSTTTKTAPGQAALTRTVDHTMDYVNCRANAEIVEPTSATLKVTTNFQFDACGNTKQIDVIGLDPSGAAMPTRTTTYSYGTRCQFSESVTLPLTPAATTAYRYDLGVPSSKTDANGLVTSWTYDNFARKTRENRPDGTYTTSAYNDCVTAPCWGVSDLRFLTYTYEYNTAGTLVRTREQFYDGLDRLRYDETNRISGTWTTQQTTYDSLGRKVNVFLPYSAGAYGNGYHQYGYDIANRPLTDKLYTNANALYRTISMGYTGMTSTVTDPNGNVITKVVDVDGNLRRVTDPNTNGTVAGTTGYDYDGFKNLTGIRDANTVAPAYSSQFTYNIRGFKTASTDVDTGSWTFAPDSLNEIWSQKDAKNQTISFVYDLLGRVTQRTEPESSTATTFTYGTSATSHNIGKLTQTTKADGYAENYVYDATSRPQTITYTVGGTNYAVDYAYNNLGAVDTLTYPASTSGYRFALKSVYDAYGYLNQVKDNSAGTVFWTINSANDSNLPTLETLGNGVQIATGYTPWTNEMTSRSEGSGGSTTNLQSLTYNWDTTGTLHQRIDNRQALTEQFTYDAMNRLKSSTLNGTTTLTMSYDATGNIATKSDVGASAYVYGDAAHKHAVTNAGTWSMSYDANGNMITRAGGTISWYSYNLPNTITYSGNSSQFFYNSNHQRWKQIASYAGTTETTLYVGGLLEVLTRGSVTEYRHQIPAGSSTVVYTRRSDGTNATYYATSDHLGSSDLVLDSSASVLARESFTPFGARRGSNWQGTPSTADYTAFSNTTRKGFSGHEMLDAVSLVHMNGRVYDPYVGRFLSADTVIQTLGSTASINPYAYAWNDPLRYVDPSGHSLLGDILGILVAAIIIIFAPEWVIPLINGWAINVTVLLAGFAGGFVAAIVDTGSLSAALTAGLIGALTAGAFYTAGSFAQSFNWGDVGRVIAHAAVGCGSAMMSGGNCGKGALSSALTEGADRLGIMPHETSGFWGSTRGTIESGIVGGLASEVAGGGFNEGFTSGASSYLFNHLGHLIVGQRAHSALLQYLQSRDGGLDGPWSGNTTLDGALGRLRADVVYDKSGDYSSYAGWEIKPAGGDAAALAQLNGYIAASDGKLYAGDNNLVFRGSASITLEDTNFLGLGATYTYYPGVFPGTITYTVQDYGLFDAVRDYYAQRARQPGRGIAGAPMIPPMPIPIPVP
jgi:RHS repeat-associated protein